MNNLKWWQQAVFYQIYPRSFADGNGDGIGDFIGMIAKLAYLRDLGIDAIWLSPHYPSPFLDCGYDIAHYTDVGPEYGSLQDFTAPSCARRMPAASTSSSISCSTTRPISMIGF
jgi:alpha-glucosidase